MPFAVELFFEEATETAVRALWRALAETGITNTMPALGARPHVSLGVCQGLDVARFRSDLAAFAGGVPALECTLASVGVFATAEAVVYLAPVVTRGLLELHEAFHTMFAKHAVSPWAYYLPGNWVPHCTLAMDLPHERVGAAVDVCRKVALPIRGRFEWAGLIEFRPVRHLYASRLGAPWPLRRLRPDDHTHPAAGLPEHRQQQPIWDCLRGVDDRRRLLARDVARHFGAGGAGDECSG